MTIEQSTGKFEIGNTYLYTLLMKRLITKEFAFFVMPHTLDKQHPAHHDNLC